MKRLRIKNGNSWRYNLKKSDGVFIKVEDITKEVMKDIINKIEKGEMYYKFDDSVILILDKKIGNKRFICDIEVGDKKYYLYLLR